MMIPIKVVEFAEYPAGRDSKDGPFNGTKFREEVLVPALRQAIEDRQRVEIILDDVKSYGSSFLEEAFGGLVRVDHFRPAQLRDLIAITAGRPVYNTYKRQIERHMNEAFAAN